MSSTNDEIRSGWMTTRDAELFGVLARGLTDDERRQLAEAITRTNDEADQHVRRSRGHGPAAEKEPRWRLGRLGRSLHPVEKRTRA